MERIGRIQYQLLKLMPVSSLNPIELEKLKDYESVTEPDEEAKLFREAYSQKLWEQTKHDVPKFEVSTMLEDLQAIFAASKGYEFKKEPDALQALKTIVYYLIKDERFFKSPMLTNLSVPSLDKGLLIIGGYGNGKSSIFEICRIYFQYYKDYSFKSFNANEVIEMYEVTNGHSEKQEFWNQVLRGRCHFDDVKTERLASNYGKTNLFKDILEKRYDARVKTYITCNYKEDSPGDIKKAIDEFGEKYGGRVHDRIFEMFTILHMKGKSYRE